MARPAETGSCPAGQAPSGLGAARFDPARERFPLIIRLLIRTTIFIAVFFAIGFASAVARHFLIDHYGIISLRELDVYRGGLNMLAILWFMGLLGSDSDTHPEDIAKTRADK